MKKILLTILMFGIVLLPTTVFAETKAENFEEVLKTAGIEHDLSNYKETDDQITIYLFYGKTCGYCHKLLTYLNSIVNDYGKYFKVVGYEVYGNKDNSKLLTKVGNFLDEDPNDVGIPFFIIGDKHFIGYGDSYNEEITTAITNLYNSKEKYDIFKEMEKAEKAENKTNGTSSTSIIIWNAAITGIATLIILGCQYKTYKVLNTKLDKLETNITKNNKIEKAKKKGKNNESKINNKWHEM